MASRLTEAEWAHENHPSPKGQLTLPRGDPQAPNLHEGDLLDVELADDSTIVLRPLDGAPLARRVSAAHQAGEREASEQAARGEGEQFASGQEFLDSLHQH